MSTSPAVNPASHVYYANERKTLNGVVYYVNASSNKARVKLFGYKEPIVAIRLREWKEGDPPEGFYLGWHKDGDDYYSMVWHTNNHFEVCFTYGSKAEEDRGYGRKVRLVVEPVI
jgi:hypothetical protein